MPAVSIIIPNYNHARFLQQRIESVLNQTYQYFEIIILDDSSTDNSREIIETYRSHSKVAEIIYNDINGGSTFKQWEKGLKKAKGEFIWIAESDDYSDSTFLENLIPTISSNKNVGLVFSNSNVVNSENIVFDTTSNWCPQLFKIDKPFEITSIQSGRFILFKYLIYYNIIPNASAAIYRKDLVLQNIHWIDTSLKNCGDWKLWINFLLFTDVAYIDKNLNYFRKHDNNVTNSDRVLKEEIIKILKELIKGSKDKFQLDKLQDSLFIWSFNYAFWDRHVRLHHENLYLYFKDNFNWRSIKRFLLYFT